MDEERAQIWKPTLQEAQAECERCQGRFHGDCSSDCACFAITASPGEVECQLRTEEFHGRCGNWLWLLPQYHEPDPRTKRRDDVA
jgi:hypothetical protein